MCMYQCTHTPTACRHTHNEKMFSVKLCYMHNPSYSRNCWRKIVNHELKASLTRQLRKIPEQYRGEEKRHGWGRKGEVRNWVMLVWVITSELLPDRRVWHRAFACKGSWLHLFVLCFLRQDDAPWSRLAWDLLYSLRWPWINNPPPSAFSYSFNT